ncbi:MAG: sugar ABC transporter permease [Oscillospiraceae bacterium]
MNRKRVNRLTKKTPYGFIAICTIPAIVMTIIFMIIPTVQALIMSFTNATGMGEQNDFIALENYQYMFGDKFFIMALKNTFKLMLVVPVITLFLGLVLGFVLTQTKLKERGVYRSVLFFPSIISLTVVAIVWSFIFHPNAGTVNNVLTNLGLESLTRDWLGDGSVALWCIAATLVWQAMGYYMVMYIAAIDGISPEIYEAATVDGASQLKKFFCITMPLLKDIIGITFVLSLSGTINLSFVIVTLMTGGGPAGASSVLLQYMYIQAFINSNFGYAMAIAVFTLLISIVLSLISRRLTNKSS